MEKKNGIIGKKILIIFEDGKEHVSKKTGICTDNNEFEVVIDNKHFIPRQRIIRVEVTQNDNR